MLQKQLYLDLEVKCKQFLKNESQWQRDGPREHSEPRDTLAQACSALDKDHHRYCYCSHSVRSLVLTTVLRTF